MHLCARYNEIDAFIEIADLETASTMFNNEGLTAYHIACALGQTEIVDHCVSVIGVDPNLATKYGESAISLAENNGQERLAFILSEL